MGTYNGIAIDNISINSGSADSLALGGSTPAAGAFTTVSASGATTLNGALVGGVQSLTGAGTIISDATAIVEANGPLVIIDGALNSGIGLPAAAAGKVLFIHNKGANTVKVWPNNGASDAINGGSADAAVSLATGVGAIFVAEDATNWYTIPGTPS